MNDLPASPVREKKASHWPSHTRLQKAALFLSGFLGWFLVTGRIVSFLLSGPRDNSFNDMGVGLLILFLIPVHIVVLAILLIRRPAIGLGMLAAVAANLVIWLIQGGVEWGVVLVPFFVDEPVFLKAFLFGAPH